MPDGTPKFPLGETNVIPGAFKSIPIEEMQQALARHERGDWGELDDHDTRANERALLDGSRLVSRYVATGGTPFWIITEWDRSLTTILLPEDY